MLESLAVGVDIGGSHITAAVVDLRIQGIVSSTLKRAAVDTQGEVEEIISAWCGVIEESGQQPLDKNTKIGVAMPGPFDYEQGIALMKEQNKFDRLYGLSVKNLLAERLKIAPENILFFNDAACFLKGEVFGGAAKGHHRALGLTLGTGFGSAICRDGGVQDANLWCDPYKGGIAEDLFSTRWFVRRYFELTGNRVNDVKELLETGDVHGIVNKVFGEFGENLGEYLVSVRSRFDFDSVVIGGNIAKSFALFSEPLRQVFSRCNLPVVVSASELNENAALVGAASGWKQAPAVAPSQHYPELANLAAG